MIIILSMTTGMYTEIEETDQQIPRHLFSLRRSSNGNFINESMLPSHGKKKLDLQSMCLLIPTQELYKKGDELKRHKDRPSHVKYLLQ